ncbi:unnamed protein product [Prunus brigantina]
MSGLVMVRYMSRPTRRLYCDGSLSSSPSEVTFEVDTPYSPLVDEGLKEATYKPLHPNRRGGRRFGRQVDARTIVGQQQQQVSI